MVRAFVTLSAAATLLAENSAYSADLDKHYVVTAAQAAVVQQAYSNNRDPKCDVERVDWDRVHDANLSINSSGDTRARMDFMRILTKGIADAYAPSGIDVDCAAIYVAFSK